MRYHLAVLTHGPDGAHLDATLSAFRQHVTPAPASATLFADGADALPRAYEAAKAANWANWVVDSFDRPRGFCAATRELWQEAAHFDGAGADYVFWLEHDFEILRPVHLRDVALVLDGVPQLAQMALMRDAVNDHEKAAGGLYESRPGQYTQRHTDAFGVPLPWLHHRAYLTTNPSLMRRDFMVENPWPDIPEFCEGRFGIQLVEAGYTFGVWGDGKPWCRHIGLRDGFGY